MAITVADLTARIYQTQNTDLLTVFCSTVAFTSDGSPAYGLLIQADVVLTPEETATLEAIGERAKADVAARLNLPTA